RLPVLAGRMLLGELDRRYAGTRSEELELLFVSLCRLTIADSEDIGGGMDDSSVSTDLFRQIRDTAPCVVRRCAHPSGTATIEQVQTILEHRPIYDRPTTICNRKLQLAAVRAASGNEFTQGKLRRMLRRRGLKVSPSWFAAKWLG